MIATIDTTIGATTRTTIVGTAMTAATIAATTGVSLNAMTSVTTSGDYRQQIRGGGYGQPRGYYADTNYQRGFGNRCRGNRSTGTIVGAIAGGLLGNSVAGRGDRLLGTVLGGGVGAVAGRAIDRCNDRC